MGKTEKVQEKKYYEITLSDEDINYILITLHEAIKQELAPSGKDEDGIYGNREVALELLELYHTIATYIVS
jgi:hypothetical protein